MYFLHVFFDTYKDVWSSILLMHIWACIVRENPWQSYEEIMSCEEFLLEMLRRRRCWWILCGKNVIGERLSVMGVVTEFCVRIISWWEALRVSPAETWLTVYRRRLVSDLNITFRFCFCDFSGVASLFWLELFFPPKLCNMTRKAYPAYAYRVIRVQRQASLDRQNFGPRRDFSILFLRFLWSGTIVLAVTIFGRFFIYINWVP